MPEHQLQAEIAFWRDMLATDNDGLPQAAVERMQYALALAERKLAALDHTLAGRDRMAGDPPGSTGILRQEH